jgi:hypothetical protein
MCISSKDVGVYRGTMVSTHLPIRAPVGMLVNLFLEDIPLGTASIGVYLPKISFLHCH